MGKALLPVKMLVDLTKDLRPFEKDRFLLAVSGGLDSAALFHIFLHFKKHFNFDFSVVHFHHGPCEYEENLDFRWKAYGFVKKLCFENKIEFFSNANDQDPQIFLQSFSSPLNSESDMRQARYEYMDELLKEKSFQHLVLAHHQDDLLETRMLRLIRGTGVEGLKAMEFQAGTRLRPLLKIRRNQLEKFLQEKKQSWFEDPSNQDSQFLRNWLRQEWFASLEEKVPGALASLQRSLDNVVRSMGQPVNLESFIEENCLKLDDLLGLDKESRRQIVAAYMKSQGLKNYGFSHISEVLKRLDREEKSHTFRLLGRRWNVDAGRMSVERPG